MPTSSLGIAAYDGAAVIARDNDGLDGTQMSGYEARHQGHLLRGEIGDSSELPWAATLPTDLPVWMRVEKALFSPPGLTRDPADSESVGSFEVLEDPRAED